MKGIIATKGNRTKTFKEIVWNLLPPDKNGWKAISIPASEEPEEVKKIDAPEETKVPLPPKVSIKAKAKKS